MWQSAMRAPCASSTALSRASTSLMQTCYADSTHGHVCWLVHYARTRLSVTVGLQVLAEAGPAGLSTVEIAKRIQQQGLRDLRTSKTPEVGYPLSGKHLDRGTLQLLPARLMDRWSNHLGKLCAGGVLHKGGVWGCLSHISLVAGKVLCRAQLAARTGWGCDGARVLHGRPLWRRRSPGMLSSGGRRPPPMRSTRS